MIRLSHTTVCPAAIAMLAAVVASGIARGEVQVNEAMLAAFQPLPEVMESPDNPLTEEKINLGRQLYYDARLSLGQDVSCNTCHLLDKYGVDGREVSLGHKKQPGTRNSPSVYNAAGHFRQFWDGRAASVEEQATMPITNPVEMACPDGEFAVKVIQSIPGYVESFQKVFPDASEPVTMQNIGKAIGAFERKLVTPAPWDAFLKGDKTAISDEAKTGFNTFITKGCIACHMGAYLGGNMYQKVGLVIPWPNQKDQGRFEVTKNPIDKMMFKSMSLRNVAKTAPYFHDGSSATLDDAVKKMALHQTGQQLSDADAAAIVAWLETLTGEIPTEYIQEPELPASGPNTPKPVRD